MNTEEIAKLAREQAQTVLRKLPLLGPISWLMMQQAATRHSFIADLEWRVMPALTLDQAKLYMKDEAPIAYASWAKLSDESIERYRQSPHRLAPSDWKSGEKIWIVDIFAPFGNAELVLKDLRENMFPSSTLYQLAPAPAGLTSVLEWPPLQARH